ncbi:ubiquinone-dependent pyruvate dehydrogenase [Nitrogeniibacter mangrovi]|uniref:Ubiquinone-dependent pyruvate dehydrogenase n=1 Tax=Nitrogeniibacter mangrovi TaxID=2016596 RepID=A0A6C1BA34_9RHOO|nr:thiamine pyrophosphate-dependent enzyme [Nitrogeniibacter mangrovi]QID19124.1 ubiquinone-dependent pyruvate dehydrogenase [Nitrogeniibacter mangrovi]
MTRTVSDIIVDVLIEAGAKRCYGIVGDTINHFTDALGATDLRWVHVRHEEVGALAAGGEAYMSGELAVCAGTCGPGSLHFVNGIFESHRNGAPVLLVASQVDRTEEGLGFPQAVDQKKIYEQCAVFCERISHPDQARRITVMAAQAALARRGVAVIVVNGDLLKARSADAVPWSVHRFAPLVRPGDDELDRLAAMIDAANRPVIYAGIGARGAHAELLALAAKIKAPIAHTSRAKEFVEPDNPYNIGMCGILGNRAGADAFDACDLLLCLGSDFAYTQFYPDEARIVQVDIDPAHIGRRTPVDLGLVGDVGATLRALTPRVAARPDDGWLTGARAQWQADLDTYAARSASGEDLIHPQTVTATLDELAAEDAIFTADGGSPMVWLLRHLRANGRRRFLTSLAHGTMANAYPQALGIALAYPGRQVIALCGDGGLSMLMGDLLTLVQERIPVKLLVYNNHSLGFVEMEQRVEGMLDRYTGLHNPDFEQLAQACGLAAWKVRQTSELASAMQAWLAVDQPALLDVEVNRMELVMPPQIAFSQVASTALFGAKAVLGGRADELVDLVRDNFLK